ncbi:hypothetical protein [Vibrio gallicus]|uniref:hypothetical protein n=1 Tax=Vibrio gallicus TaxID=190897 RepID=UPI0021C3EF26|nr:hypothetical protein [Vibrio gallicus]
MKIIHLTILAVTFLSIPAKANSFHFSPEIKTGPYAGSGLSGYGFQFGLNDIIGLRSLYISYTDTNSKFLNVDKDQITTYRVGGQIPLVESIGLSLLVEAGFAKYNGEREYAFGDTRYLEQSGASTSVAVAYDINQHVAVKAGMDLSYLDSSSTLLSSSIAPTFSTGFIFKF